MNLSLKIKRTLMLGLVLVLFPSFGFAQDLAGRWDAQIDCPGGGIDFGLELAYSAGQWSGFLINGPERIKVPFVEVNQAKLTLRIDHYDSIVELEFSGTGDEQHAEGTWKKRRGSNKWLNMTCSARRHKTDDVFEGNKDFVGRWAVQFSESEEPAVGIFNSVAAENRVSGTFLTSTGDYRFLDGGVQNKTLRLSCFDGAHAFLFKAKLVDTGVIKGEFWSSNTWHETWTAKLDNDAAIPDEFNQTSAVQGYDLGLLSFPDLQGKPTRLDDPKFAGKARIIYVFGSWCPNCHDAGAYFAELEKKYAEHELSILGLAFEMTGEFERDAQQVKKYLHRHGSNYPVLVAGLADKTKATEAFPVLDRVRSYPTTIFLDRDGQVTAVHTGFTGPATGSAYDDLKQQFERRIEQMLGRDR